MNNNQTPTVRGKVLNPSIFVNAARLVFESNIINHVADNKIGACRALANLIYDKHDDSYFDILQLFNNDQIYWWDWPCDSTNEDNEARILALLLCAEMVK